MDHSTNAAIPPTYPIPKEWIPKSSSVSILYGRAMESVDQILAFKENLDTLNEDGINELVRAYNKVIDQLITEYNLNPPVRAPLVRVVYTMEMEKAVYDYRLTISKLLSRYVTEPPTAHRSTTNVSTEDPFSALDPSKLNRDNLEQDTILSCWTELSRFHRLVYYLSALHLEHSRIAKLHAELAISAQRAIYHYAVNSIDPTSSKRLDISLTLAQFQREAFPNKEAESIDILNQALSHIPPTFTDVMTDLPGVGGERKAIDKINDIRKELEMWDDTPRP